MPFCFYKFFWPLAYSTHQAVQPFGSTAEKVPHKVPHRSKKGLGLNQPNPLFLLVRPAGFEPAAYGFEVQIIHVHQFSNISTY